MDDRTLITEQIVATVLDRCSRKHSCDDGDEVLAREPVLRKVLQAQLLGIAGKLVLSGAPAKLARDVAADIDRLAVFAAAVMREAYRELLADLMPDDPVPSRGARGKRKKPRGTNRARRRAQERPPQVEGNGDETADN